MIEFMSKYVLVVVFEGSMSTLHLVIPIDDERLSDEDFVKWLEAEGVFFPHQFPLGRWPTRTELRQVLTESGYTIDVSERRDCWDISLEDESTSLVFSDDIDESDDGPVEFYFRNGIVLGIVQRIANVCGCQLSWTDTGWPPVLLVPDTFFPAYEQPTSGFFFLETIERRLPYMIEQLKKPIDSASTDETLFFVSQIRQAMLRAEIWQRHELVRTLQYKTSVYSRLLEHDDMRVRYLALALTASNKMLSSPEQSEALRQAIAHEPDPATKTRMIYAIGDMVLNVYSLAPNWVPPWKEVLPDLLHQLSEIESEPLTVRLAACIVMARARPGLLTPPMKPIFVEALINPAKYHIANYSYGNAEQILKTIENLALHDRITILLAALPQMEIVEDAHSALRNLLDYAFFGEIRLIWAGSLKDDQPAERPAIDESKFRRQRPGTWSYPAKPTPINPADLLPFQRHILETALELEIPWMVHSNLLEKYGLPPTRAEVRVLLEEQK